MGVILCAALVLATSQVQAEVAVREDGESLRFVRDGVVFAEMARPDSKEVSLTVSCADEFVRLELAPAAGAARTVRTLALPEIRLTERLRAARTLGSGGLKELGADKGSYTFLAVAEPVTRRGVVAAFLTGRKGSGVLFSSVTNGCAAIRPEIQYGRLALDAGEATVGETLLIGAFDDCRLGLERYADEVAKAYRVRLNPQVAGYCTWYADRHGEAGDEASTAAFAECAAKKLVPWGLDFFQIDSDWQAGIRTNMMCRDFRRVNPKGPYSNGLARTTATLKAHGLKSGLWFMPFCGSQLDPAYADRQDLFVRSRIATKRPDGVDWQCAVMDNEVGRPYECIWGGTVLDYTNPKTHDYLRELVTRFRDKWGFSYFKCDALWGAVATQHMYPSDEYRPDDLGEQIFHDPKATNMENARRGLEALRAIAGKDVFLLGCNLSQSMRSMVSCYGIVDAMRVGPDNSSKWDGIKAGPIRGTSRYFLNGRVWYNDPDPVYVRDAIPEAHARVSATWTALSGGLYAFSDWLGDLSDRRVDILRRTLAPHRLYTKVRPVDLFESDLANTWLLADGDACVFGFFNWDEKAPLAVNYDAAYAGLDPEKTYVGFDFWENKFIAPFKGTVRADVGAGDTKVWQLREFDGTRPVLVSTSRHVASPLFEVTGERWDADARTLSGTSQVVANDPYELRIVLPRGFLVGAFTGADDAKVTVEDETVRVAFVPQAGKVAWRISFNHEKKTVSGK